jgi:hypothetical protein
MGLLDSIKNLFKGKEDQVNSGVDKAADVVDDKTGGEHTEQIDDAAAKAKDVLGTDEA